MASHHHHPHHHHQPPPPPPPCTHCCFNPSPTSCCTTPPPPQQQDHHHLLLQVITLLLSQPQHNPITTIPHTHHHHYPKSHTFVSQTHHQHQHQHQTHSASISSLLHRIECLESSLLSHHHHSLSSSSSLSLRHAAARVIQTHFRSFLARRSRTLRHLKHLALIKSTFNSLKSSLSQNITHHLDFPSLSLKAFNLLLQLDSIEVCDPMIVDGKKSITRDLVQFLDSIEGVAVKKKRMHCVKSAKSGRFAQRVNKSRDSDDDEKRKLLQNLRGRVERINRLCKVSENEEGDFEHEGVHNVGGDYGIYDNGDGDRVSNVVISGRNEVFPKKNVVFVHKQGVQPRVKKSVKFAENGKICEVYSSSSGGAYEPDLSGDVVCLDESSCSDDQGEVSEHVGCAVEDEVDPSQDDDEALVENGGEPPHSSDDGGRNHTRAPKNDSRNIVKGQIQTQQGKILFSAPMPLKMENKTELMKSKGVRILT